MATFVRAIAAEEEDQLCEFAKSQDEVTSRRAQCILTSSQGKTTAEIGAELGLSERSVRNIVVAFNKTGVESVPRAPVTGRPRRLDSVSTTEIEQVIADSPRRYGLESDYWSLETLAVVLAKSTGAKGLSADTLAREMKRRGMDWQQTKQEHARSVTQTATMNAQANRCTAPQPSSSLALRLSECGVYARGLLRPHELETYDAVIGNMRDEFSVNGGGGEMHIQIAAVCYLRFAQAQLAEDWNKAETYDRMLTNHLKELRTAKKKQDAQATKTRHYSQADWATELLEELEAAEASAEDSETTDASHSDMSDEDMRALMDESFAKWKEMKESQ